MRDPYELLGVERSATQREIKAAFRQLAKELHPDLHPGDTEVEERFKEISIAYDILTDPEKLAKYESGRMGGGGYDPFATGPGQGPVAFDENFGRGDTIADLYGDIAGNRRGRGGTSMWLKGQDMFHSIEIPFVDAANGVQMTIELPTTAKVEVSVPAGTSHEDMMYIEGAGFPGMGGGPPGELNLQIKVADDPVLSREGDDVVMELDIPPDQATAGATLSVPTVDGDAELEIPAGSEDGQVFRLPNRGIINRDTDRRGDQLVTLRIPG